MSLQGVVGPPGEGLHEAVVAAAERHSLDPVALDWHLEAVHGMERHDVDYVEAAEIAAKCLASGGCERYGTAATGGPMSLQGIVPTDDPDALGTSEPAAGCGCGACSCQGEP